MNSLFRQNCPVPVYYTKFRNILWIPNGSSQFISFWKWRRRHKAGPKWSQTITNQNGQEVLGGLFRCIWTRIVQRWNCIVLSCTQSPLCSYTSWWRPDIIWPTVGTNCLDLFPSALRALSMILEVLTSQLFCDREKLRRASEWGGRMEVVVLQTTINNLRNVKNSWFYQAMASLLHDLSKCQDDIFLTCTLKEEGITCYILFHQFEKGDLTFYLTSPFQSDSDFVHHIFIRISYIQQPCNKYWHVTVFNVIHVTW